jgi:hypothetical protein
VAQLHGRTLFPYRERGVLRFRVDDKDIPLTAGTIVTLEQVSDRENCIAVHGDEVKLFTWTYRRPDIFPPLALDPTPFVEEEHFDFCPFVFNAANDAGRRNRIYRLRGEKQTAHQVSNAQPVPSSTETCNNEESPR